MAYILSHILRHCIHSQPCRLGILLGLLLFLISPVLASSAILATAKGQAEQAEFALNAIYLPLILRNATLTGLIPTPALTPFVPTLPTDTAPAASILPTGTPTPSDPLPESFTPTTAPTLLDTPTVVDTPTLIAPPVDVTTVPTTPAITLTATAIQTTVATPMPTATPVDTLLPTATPTLANTPAPIPTQNSTPTGSNAPLLYLSSDDGGTVGGIAYADEDILSYNTTTGIWTMIFDGSDVGIGTDVNALHIDSDGSLLLSFNTTTTLPSLGAVAETDIVRFLPTTLGANTTGSFVWFFDGSDVGLDTADEDIDAITRLSDGRLVISTNDFFNASGVSGVGQDLFLFTADNLGETTSGVWQLYFDGSDVGLIGPAEDIWGAEIGSNGAIYLNTNANYNVAGLTGDSDDIFVCTPASLGDTTSCTFSLYWNGDNYDFGAKWLDVLALSEVTLATSPNGQRTTAPTEPFSTQVYFPFIKQH